MGVASTSPRGPALERAGDLAAILTSSARATCCSSTRSTGCPAVEEILYPAMEDFQIDIVLGKGPAARAIRPAAAPFTLVGATTRTGSSPARCATASASSPGSTTTTPDELEAIVTAPRASWACELDRTGRAEIARRSRGTPRIANRLLRRVRDFAEVRGDGTSTRDRPGGLELFGVDELGLDKVDRAILGALCRQFGGAGGAVDAGHRVGEQTETVEDVYEPFLIQQGC
jgi:holliday junction DNA helicase RuvB